MPLSISDFSAVSELSAQTLRHYHAEGLLLPAEVDERTGYRGYAFEQVQQAVLVAAMRGAGISVREVRAALEDPDGVQQLLREHREVLDRRRAQEDAALAEAWTLVTDWPRVRLRHVPAVDVVAVQVPAVQVPAVQVPGDQVPGDQGAHPARQVVPEHVADAARALAAALRERGADVLASPWCAYLLTTPEQKAKVSSPAGPDWECAVAVGEVGERSLPAGAVLSSVAALQEVAVLLPGRRRTATYAAAVQHVLSHCLERALVPDLGGLRHVLHEDGVEIAVPVRARGDHPTTAGTAPAPAGAPGPNH